MPGMNERFVSNGLSLACHIAVPAGPIEPGPAVILCHGFPIASLDAQRAGGTFPQLMDRTARELRCIAMTFNFRGCGESEGDFSLQGWVDDLRNAIAHVLTLHETTGVILLGTNTGGSIAICVAADDPRVSAAGLLSPRADFDDWADHPRRFLEHARDIGAIHSRDFPPSVEEWAREFRRFRPVASARRFAPRPLLVMHGEDDDSVPVSDARQLVNAHGSAELSLFEGAGHRLRHDPRAVAVLLGWLDRIRSTHVHPSSELV
jgi:putative redox protein